MRRFVRFKRVVGSWLARIFKSYDPSRSEPGATIGILAYGSLLSDPGIEIEPLIVRRIATRTPFPVEYARLSQKRRGGAPTVVPHPAGGRVNAEILVLQPQTAPEEAMDLLWRRETHSEETGKPYSERSGPNAVLIRDTPGLCGVDHVLHTDFDAEGKLPVIDPGLLAAAAIDSVSRADYGMDGISYLIGLTAAGVKTPLTEAYIDEVLARTDCSSLTEALGELRERRGPR